MKCAKKSKQKKAHPIIRPRLRRGSFAPSSLRGSAYKGHPWPFKPLAASMPLAPLRNDSTHPPEGAIRAPETIGLTPKPWRLLLLLLNHSEQRLGYLRFRRVQSPPRRANGIVVEEVERHGCRESCDGPGMAHRGGPLERRWSERTLAKPGPDERAEGFGYFCPQKLLAREGETKNINKNAAIRNRHQKTQIC